MMRASDVFGRSAGAGAGRPTVPAGLKRSAPSGDAPVSRTWDPATGQYVDEDLPAEVYEMMGIKKPKVLFAPKDENAWGESRGALAPAAKKETTRVGPPAPINKVDKTAPSVEYQGFRKVDLNDRYFERANLQIHSRPTYWNEDITFFVYWQGEVQRWAICDAASFTAVKAGQYPGWAYKEDHRHLFLASGWMEAFNGAWDQPDLEVITRSNSKNKAQWEDPMVQKSISIVDFRGFSMQELNTRYHLKAGEVLQGKPSYWDESGVYFIYWQRDMNRWAICDLKCLEAVQNGQCPGWAYRTDAGHFANACGWMEQRSGEWAEAMLETGVVATCTKGLKVEFHGFAKEELNTVFTEKPGEEIQGKATLWDSQDTFFVYWQSSYARWAISDSASLTAAQKGLAPGWAFRTDSKHFGKSTAWMENSGKDWEHATVKCTVLEGTVREDWAQVKAEMKEEQASGTNFSGKQYTDLLDKVYNEKNPSKLDDLPALLEKFAGREKALYEMVCKKYSVNPAAFAKKYGVVGSDEAAGEDDEYAQYENQDLPVLTSRQYAVRVQNIYVKHNANKLVDLPRLLQKFRNRERQLYLEVCKKYGVHPTKFHYKCLKEGADA